MGRADRLPTPEQLREAMSLDEELKVTRDFLWNTYPLIAAKLDQHLIDYCAHCEYGSGDFP